MMREKMKYIQYEIMLIWDLLLIHYLLDYHKLWLIMLIVFVFISMFSIFFYVYIMRLWKKS